MPAGQPRSDPTVVVDEWRVVAYASPTLSPNDVRRLRRRVERALTRAVRRTSRRRRPRADVRLDQ
jgi:hypothetical protein